jgi:hypothetical protein
MIAKINGYPTEEELRNRIARQLSWRGTDTVALLWHGYLNGLVEWGLIELSVYDRLCKLFPVGLGAKEIYEQFSDEPLSSEQEAEIDEYWHSQGKKDAIAGEVSSHNREPSMHQRCHNDSQD